MYRLRHGYRNGHRTPTQLTERPIRNPADISLTARYTAAVWDQLGLPHAARFADVRGRTLLKISHALLGWMPQRLGFLFIEGGLIPRHLFMDEWIRAQQAKQVVEVAAGYSPRGLMFAGEGVRYIEVDRPNVMAEKRRRCHGVPSDRLPCFVSADVTGDDFVARVLAECDPGLPTVIVNEGMSPYFPRNDYLLVLRRFAELARRLQAPFLTDFYRAARSERTLGLWARLGGAMLALVADRPFLYVTSEGEIESLFREAGFRHITISKPAAMPKYTRGVRPAVTDWLYMVEARV